jgi:hypothetical protein
MTEIEVKQQIVDETVAKQNAKNEKQRLIDRGLLPTSEKEQAKLKENHGVTYQSPCKELKKVDDLVVENRVCIKENRVYNNNFLLADEIALYILD